MELLRILEVITPSKLAGAEIFLTELSKGLAERGNSVTVVCKAVPEVVEHIRAAGLDVRSGGIGGKLNVLSMLRLARTIREERIDIINSHLSTASLVASLAGRLTGVPVVATVHGLNTGACFRFARHLIAVSRAVKDSLVSQSIPPERVSVIYPGIDLSVFSSAGSGPAVRRELGLRDDALVVGMVAHLSRKKGHHILLSAAERIISAMPDCRFLLVGAGPLLETLRETVERSNLAGNIVFAGFRDDIRDVIESMDIVVLPSISGEGLPVSLIQAMALSRPVVGSRLSGIPEIVESDIMGLLVQPGDPDELAAAVVRLAGDPGLRAKMGAAARKRVENTFTLDACVYETEKLYRQMVESNRLSIRPGEIETRL